MPGPTSAPQVTVCIPTLLRSSLVERALPSVLVHTVDLEVVVAASGGTAEAAQAVVSVLGDDRVRTVGAPSGASAARNAAAAAATGDALVFLDDDDELAPDALEVLLGMLGTLGVAYASGACRETHPDGSIEVRRPQPLGPLFGGLTGLHLAGTFAVAREVFEAVGGYDTDLAHGENHELVMRIGQEVARRGALAAHTDAVLVDYAPSGVDYSAQAALAGPVVLRTHAAVLRRDRALRAQWEGLTGVALVRAGETGRGRRHLAAAVRARPLDPTNAVRLALSAVPSAARRRWALPAGAAAPGPARPLVLVVIDTLGAGGAEESTLAVLPRLRDHGVDVRVLIRRAIAPEREDRLRAVGIPVDVLPTGGRATLTRALRSELRRRPPDLLHVTLFDPVLAGSVAAVGTPVPVLGSIVNTPPELSMARGRDTAGHEWKVRVVDRLEGWVLRHLTTHVHAVTPGVADAVVARFGLAPDRVSVVERGRDPERFGPRPADDRAAVRAELGVGADEQVVVALARHEPQKGLADLVDAVAHVAPTHPRLRVLVAGRTGSATSELEAGIARHGLGEVVTLLGDRPDPERLLGAADVFVLASRREGASGATVEAMGVGVPVVATAVTGLAGILVDGQNARVVPVRDPAALGRGLAELLDDPDQAARLAAAGRQTFLERFTVATAAGNLADLYRTVAAAGR